jgi:hypothetical protein
MSQLLDFLTGLATDSRQQAVFFNNSDNLINKAGLSKEETIWVKTGNKEKISATFADDFTVLAAGCMDPGDDPLPDPDPPSIIPHEKTVPQFSRL